MGVGSVNIYSYVSVFFLCSRNDCTGIFAHIFFVSTLVYFCFLLVFASFFLVPCHLFIFKVEALKHENIFK